MPASVPSLLVSLSLHWVGLATRVSCLCVCVCVCVCTRAYTCLQISGRGVGRILLSRVPLVSGGGEVMLFLWQSLLFLGKNALGS